MIKLTVDGTGIEVGDFSNVDAEFEVNGPHALVVAEAASAVTGLLKFLQDHIEDKEMLDGLMKLIVQLASGGDDD